jgi:hypothetical protein
MKQLLILLLFLIVSFTVIGFSRDIKIIKVGEWGTGEYEYEDVFILGKYAYCAASEAGLEILNVGNPYSPYQVGNYQTADGAFGIDVKDNYAYVAAGKGGLQVIDITKPSDPIPVGTADLNIAYADKLYVRDIYVYVCAYDGLKIIDVSTPSSPTLLLNFDINGVPSGISFSGDYAYISTWVNQYTDEVPGIHILDISNPTAPQLVGVYDNGYTGDSFGIAVRGNYAYLVSYENLIVVDISNPASPFEVGTCWCFSSVGDRHEIYLNGDYAYIAAFDAGIKVIDISDPTSPTLAAIFEVPGDARDIHIKDDYIYAADGNSGKFLILKVHHRIPPGHQRRWKYLKQAFPY